MEDTTTTAEASLETVMDRLRFDVERESTDLLRPDVFALIENLAIPKPIEEQKALVRSIYASTGTDMDRNDADNMGDGDQTPIRENDKAQVFRELWGCGADVLDHLAHPEALSSSFCLAVIKGDATAVKSALCQTRPFSKERQQLLETRDTGFRMPPLLTAMAVSKHTQIMEDNLDFAVSQMDHLGIVRILLEHGARPDAKDVAGKNASHYGAGAMATADNLVMADWCIEAAKSCAAYGKTVKLGGLKTASFNGRTGLLGGYLSDQRRRWVYLHDENKNNQPVERKSIKPENIFLQDKCIQNEDYNLVDQPDRLGSVVLQEVLMSARTDVAKFLCKKHNASLDVPDATGLTPRNMAFQQGTHLIQSGPLRWCANTPPKHGLPPPCEWCVRHVGPSKDPIANC